MVGVISLNLSFVGQSPITSAEPCANFILVGPVIAMSHVSSNVGLVANPGPASNAGMRRSEGGLATALENLAVGHQPRQLNHSNHSVSIFRSRYTGL